MHFLGSRQSVRRLLSPRAIVQAALGRRDRRRVLVVVPGSLAVAQAESQWIALPPAVAVLDSEGKEIRPSKGTRFWVSAETFDPVHGLLEM